MSNLLFLNELVSEDLTDVITLVATILVALLIVAVCILMAKSKLKTTDIVYAGVSLASSFVLSFIKIAPVQYGGSITFASFVPLLIYTFYFGFSRGLVCGLIYGVLQFLQDPYILTPVTFILDYLLAFASIAVMGFFAKNYKNKTSALVLGATCVYLCRFLMHFASGIVYFNMDAVWASIPASNAVVYSLLYQVVYLVPDAIICIIAILILSRGGIIDKIKPKQ
ncbi:MAG: energy-coupled thiamine transporter ThiT [Clostridia bacterium]|nr:energy-coupled thiamine transporter ThiT [Clostridia bacterium]